MLYEKAYLREKKARLKAERILEDLSYEIYYKNQALERANLNLLKEREKVIQSEKGMAMGALVAGVIHEVNNPLTFVLSNFNHLIRILQKLREDVDLAQDPANEVIEVIEDISDGLHRIEKIVSNLRVYAYSSAQNFEPCDIDEVMQVALKLAQTKLSDSTQIDLQEVAGVVVWGNSGQLVQVFSNLLTNASQSSDGPVKITVDFEVSLTEVVVSVEDNGGGIEAEYLGKIFDPFFTTKDIGSGVGIGLSVVYGILQQHAGAIEVDTVVGVGTTFTIKLPVFTASTFTPVSV